jgi:hypothetical protein
VARDVVAISAGFGSDRMTNTIDAIAGLLVQPGVAAMHLERYFRPTVDIADSQQTGFSGRFFESYIATSRTEAARHPSFTPWEILAVDALGVQVPAAYVSYLVDPETMVGRSSGPRRLGELIAACHEELAPGLPLAPVASDRPALDRLYQSIHDLKGMGHVKTSKLLAAKFPDAVPISDTRVNALLGFSYGRDRSPERWWSTVAALLSSGGVADALARSEGCPSDRTVGLLRRLDVVLWMEHRWRQRYGRLVMLLQGRSVAVWRTTDEARSLEARRLIAWFDNHRAEVRVSNLHKERLAELGPA